MTLAGGLSVNSDVIVVGAGIVGLSSAYFLVSAGLSVTVIDDGQPASERCSSGNAGMIVPSHFVTFGDRGVGWESTLVSKEPPRGLAEGLESRGGHQRTPHGC